MHICMYIVNVYVNILMLSCSRFTKDHKYYQWPREALNCKHLFTYVMRCAIWYHLYYFKNVKNTDRVVLILVKLQAEACNFTKINTPLWVFFTFLKLYKWYQIVQCTTYWFSGLVNWCHVQKVLMLKPSLGD